MKAIVKKKSPDLNALTRIRNSLNTELSSEDKVKLQAKFSKLDIEEKIPELIRVILDSLHLEILTDKDNPRKTLRLSVDILVKLAEILKPNAPSTQVTQFITNTDDLIPH